MPRSEADGHAVADRSPREGDLVTIPRRWQANVTIKRHEPQVLTADADGVVRLEIEKSVAAQDPQIVVSEKLLRLLVN